MDHSVGSPDHLARILFILINFLVNFRLILRSAATTPLIRFIRSIRGSLKNNYVIYFAFRKMFRNFAANKNPNH